MPVTYTDITDAQDVGQRIDNFLMRILKGVPRSYVYRILRRGEVRVNGGRIKPEYRLQQDDRIRVPPVRTKDQVPVQYSRTTAELLEQATLFQDDDYLIINKPSGLAVHGGSGLAGGAVEILRELTGNKRLELIHRLDRDTSGCLAFAKNRQALTLAQAEFRERRVKKIYEAFVQGDWKDSDRVVQKRLQRFETSSGERRVRVDNKGQSARTDFAVITRAGKLATRLQATLHTGRTHQIRVHTLSCGHPIIGDDKYSRTPVTLADNNIEMRLCLHAKKLAIPLGQDMLKVSAPVEDQMERIWSALLSKTSEQTH